MPNGFSKAVFGCAAIALAIFIEGQSALVAKEKPMTDKQVEQLFASVCGFCHQDGGRVAGKGPQLAHTGQSDAFIINRIKNGKEGAMPAFEGRLTDAQIKAIIHYIRHLEPE
jgi:mono/diheme cytochrome c family protein